MFASDKYMDMQLKIWITTTTKIRIKQMKTFSIFVPSIFAKEYGDDDEHELFGMEVSKSHGAKEGVLEAEDFEGIT